jgi:hypothetical protein
VHEDEVGAELGRALEQLRAGRDAGHDGLDLVGSGYLQAVRAIVVEGGRREELVEVLQQVGKHVR